MQCERPGISWIDHIALNTPEIVSMNRVRSGHAPFNKFWYFMRKVNSSNCEVCEIPEDVYLLLIECVRTEPIMVRLLAQVGFSTFNVG